MDLGEVFDRAYTQGTWGGGSGGGSGPEARAPWTAVANAVIALRKPSFIHSIGCGDGWADYDIDEGDIPYVGWDVSEEAIRRVAPPRLTRLYGVPEDPLHFLYGTERSLVLLKEVTQHLSYADIGHLLSWIKAPILHCTGGAESLNSGDIDSGPGVCRGISLLLPPFNRSGIALHRWRFGGAQYLVELIEP
jgi:hypothetical protein